MSKKEGRVKFQRPQQEKQYSTGFRVENIAARPRTDNATEAAIFSCAKVSHVASPKSWTTQTFHPSSKQIGNGEGWKMEGKWGFHCLRICAEGTR
jgi:hypothetical protein